MYESEELNQKQAELLEQLDEITIRGRNQSLERRRANQREWRKENPDKKYYDPVHVRAKKYNLTPAEVEDMLSKGCQVCGSFERLHIDHDHNTGEVRGCLCHGCNTGLGLLKEDPDRIRALAAYIEQF